MGAKMLPQLMSLKGHLADLVDLVGWGDLIVLAKLRYYMPAGTSGDKPSYKKDGSGTGDDEVGQRFAEPKPDESG